MDEGSSGRGSVVQAFDIMLTRGKGQSGRRESWKAGIWDLSSVGLRSTGSVQSCRERTHRIMASPYSYPPIPADCIGSPKPPVGSIHLPELTLVPRQSPVE